MQPTPTPTPTPPERARSHARAVSGDDRRRVALPRRSTRGPLDADAHADDPLAAPHVSPPQQAVSGQQRVQSPSRSETDTSAGGDGASAGKDFSFLQDPAAYHVLSPTNIPPQFLHASTSPSLSSPIDSLLRSGHYRLAAIAAARNIVTAASPADHDTLFRLLHIRLACLCLLSEHALAAQESKVLGDLNSPFYQQPPTTSAAHLVPWHLRLLVVRLSALGYGEWRKGIMGYYELARECRENILQSEAADDEEKALWKTRLHDCGIRVANVLVEMGDLEGAGRHLASLSSTTPSRDVLTMEALIWLRVGDMRAARRSLSAASALHSDALVDGTLQALMQLANGDYPAAVSSFTALREQFPADAMLAQNLAVTLLYTGHISQARDLLTEIVDASAPFHALVFNLSTVYELCTERNRDRKGALAGRLAERKGDGSVGWEIGNVDFKL
ncbi:hypothetical protein BDV95DRAFT_570737 [Massariosphaeria phaeospora]|uniref:Tetratricopeptide repeat protein 15 n=1 Tax=Massariosphaeria phaeospora TaxID=100035 RepID=A0A7C8I681_9PLEO|nr:hypothetical protein BDV95DRAFT_570737 [Massariosphaeria phaeospora]